MLDAAGGDIFRVAFIAPDPEESLTSGYHTKRACVRTLMHMHDTLAGQKYERVCVCCVGKHYFRWLHNQCECGAKKTLGRNLVGLEPRSSFPLRESRKYYVEYTKRDL